MNFRRVCQQISGWLCVAMMSAPVVSQEIGRQDSLRPNVILIVSSDHGRADLGCYGNKVIKTPNLNRLSAEGIRLTSAYGTTASSSASCSVILTGLYSHANGQYGLSDGYHHFATFPEVKFLPQYLKEAGYRTGRAGKYQLSTENAALFDTVMGGQVSDRNAYEMAGQCAGFLKRDVSEPFFLYFAPGDPHRSGQTVDESPYKPDRFGNIEAGYEGILPTYYLQDKMEVPSFLPDLPECRAELAQYAEAVSRMDLGIGRLFEILRKEHLWENTLIIYLSDSGIAFPGAKTTLYDPGIHLPCIVKPPFSDLKGQNCDAMVNWADITPTILDFCRALPADMGFHGHSFKQALKEENPTGWDRVFASHTFHEVTMYYPMRSIQNRQYKLIWNIAYQLPFPFSAELKTSGTWQGFLKSKSTRYGKRTLQQFIQRPEFELYDINQDPDEVNNLSLNLQFAQILEDMKMQLKNFQVNTNDPWILKWSYP